MTEPNPTEAELQEAITWFTGPGTRPRYPNPEWEQPFKHGKNIIAAYEIEKARSKLLGEHHTYETENRLKAEAALKESVPRSRYDVACDQYNECERLRREQTEKYFQALTLLEAARDRLQSILRDRTEEGIDLKSKLAICVDYFKRVENSWPFDMAQENAKEALCQIEDKK